MGIYKNASIISDKINKSYVDREFTAAVMYREFTANDRTVYQIKNIFGDASADSIMDILLDIYYDISRASAQNIAWALMDLLNQDNAYSWQYDTEIEDWIIYPDYQPDDFILLRDAVVDLL
jgi:selenophosphate synthase